MTQTMQSKNKVLLINPPSNSPQPIMPLGLAYLASSLLNNGFEVNVIDAWAEAMTLQGLQSALQQHSDANLVGVTVMSPTYPVAIQTINAIREVLPQAKIIAGGTHPSSCPKECLIDIPALDFVCAGEGDNIIVQVAKKLNDADTDYSGISGLYYRKDGMVEGFGKADVVQDLDSLPFPARQLFRLDRYVPHPPYRRHKKFATMITSRGCPYSCTYCTKSVSGRNFRFQSSERVIAEIQHLINEYGIEQLHFYDDDFTINKKRVSDLCDTMIDMKIKISWSCVTRIDLVDADLLKKMKLSGCWLISYGVESGNQEILDSVKKGYKIEHIKKAFADTKSAGIRTLGYFMAGFPGENKQTLNETVKLSFELDPDFVSWSILALYPGSTLFEMALSGQLGDAYTKASASVDTIARNTSSLSPYAHGHAFIYDGALPRDYILKVVEKAYKDFYFRLSYIAKFIFKLRTVTEVMSYLKAFFQYLSWKGRR